MYDEPNTPKRKLGCKHKGILLKLELHKCNVHVLSI